VKRKFELFCVGVASSSPAARTARPYSSVSPFSLLFFACSAIGDLYNFHLDPSLTLGCGSWGSTSVSANVGPQHLLNVKTVAMRQENMLWFRAPPKIYFKRGALDLALQELKGW
jgi:hypothetical protein